jgi:UDPglucose 6-dehydrogenase
MISVANALAELCEHIGADWREIMPALKLDKRIGPFAYLSPGLGLAGGNLERDLATVCRLAEEHGADAGVVQAWIDNSRYRKDWALRILHSQVLAHYSDLRLGILGLAYKEDTHSTKNSPSLALIACLKDWPIQVYDPIVSPSVLDHPSVGSAGSSLEAARNVDVLVIMTPWAEFRELKPADLRQAMKGNVIIDPFQVLSGSECTSIGFQYFSLGRPLHQ